MGLAIASAQAPSGLASGATITAQLAGTSGGGRSAAAASVHRSCDKLRARYHQRPDRAGNWHSLGDSLDRDCGWVSPARAGARLRRPEYFRSGQSIARGARLRQRRLRHDIVLSDEASAGSYTVAGNWNASVPIGSALMIGAAIRQQRAARTLRSHPDLLAASGQVTSAAAIHWPFLDVRVG